MKNNFTKLALLSILMVSSTYLSANEAPMDAQKLQELGAMMGQMQQKMQANPKMSKEEQKHTLLEMDEGINHIEKSLPCIKKAQTMSDMMQCNEMRED